VALVGRSTAELPVVHLHVGVPVRRQDRACRIRIPRPDQGGRTQPGGAIVRAAVRTR
jgi:hypothetical protein